MGRPEFVVTTVPWLVFPVGLAVLVRGSLARLLWAEVCRCLLVCPAVVDGRLLLLHAGPGHPWSLLLLDVDLLASLAVLVSPDFGPQQIQWLLLVLIGLNQD